MRDNARKVEYRKLLLEAPEPDLKGLPSSAIRDLLDAIADEANGLCHFDRQVLQVARNLLT